MKFKEDLFRDRNYILDNHGNILKIVGDDHDDFVVAYIKYYPSPTGTRTFLNRQYSVNTDVYNSFYILSEFGDKLKYSYKHGNCVTGCLKKDVINIFDARNKLSEILESKSTFRNRSKPSSTLISLLECLESENISLNNIGITGSFLIGVDTSKSDIDLVSYGNETTMKLYEFFKNSSLIDKYEGKNLISLLERRYKHMPQIPSEIMAIQENRKIQGIYQGIHINAQPIKEKIKKSNNHYVDMGEMSIIGDIVDDSESIYAPAYYKIANIEILDGYCSENIKKRLDTIISFVGAYSQILKKSEKFYAKGTLLRNDSSELSYALSIDPWNRGRENKLQLVK